MAIENGLRINTVVDVGAAFGEWTKMCISLFPHARYVLFEPLPLYDEWLMALGSEHPNTFLVKAAASDHLGRAVFYMHEDWVCSLLYQETEGPQVDGFPVEVDITTIDSVLQEQKLPEPFLLKIDVHGAELDVLKGATKTLERTEYVLIETSLFQFFKGGPLIHDVIAFMLRNGFVIYDILNLSYRPLDNALAQVDLVFVPEKKSTALNNVVS